MRRIIPALLFVAVLAGGFYGRTRQLSAGSASSRTGTIVGSGTIEADSLVIAAETGGRVVEVFVEEGAEVERGQVLVQLDASLLLAQGSELETAVATAEANLKAVREGPGPEAIAVAEKELDQARAERDSAYQVWQQLLRLVEQPQNLLLPIRELEARIRQAEGQVELAQSAANAAGIQEEAASRNQSSHAALVAYDIAQKQRQAAEIGVALSEAQLSILEVQLAHLWEQYNNPLTLQARANQAESGYLIAEAAVALANANLAATRAAPMAEEIAVAEAQVRLAQSGLAVLQAQLDRLTLTAPRTGLISTRVADPGELAVPGATLLTLVDLDRVRLKVFVPETQIGRVKLGQTAYVTVDSVPQPFEGAVTFIGSEAEFTPKNVQTREERVNLVFAVDIGLDNPEHIFKPGMPADAEILP